MASPYLKPTNPSIFLNKDFSITVNTGATSYVNLEGVKQYYVHFYSGGNRKVIVIQKGIGSKLSSL